ncbi:MAG: hypothetical protein L0I00_07825, partial [Lactiplantibacillus plantarum]|nr:hypothetical protein [Lactiplantibacillus plantarum]
MYLLAATTITYVTNLVAGLRRPKYRWAEWLFLICLIILLGGNTQNADFFTYQWLYQAHIPYGEPGYRVLTRIGPMLGLDYRQFRLVLAAIFL